MPAAPGDGHQPRVRAARPRRGTAPRIVRSSASRPISGASSPSTRWTPPTPDSTRVACHSSLRLGLALQRVHAGVVEPDGGRGQPMGRGVDQTVPRLAAACTRAAVFTASPATMPSPVAPGVTATSPVTTPARSGQSGRADLDAERRDRGDEVERSPHGALGVALGRDRRAPHRHHRVADELLDHAAVPVDHRARGVEVARQQFADLLRVARLGQRREPTRSAEQDGADPPLGDVRRRPEWSWGAGFGGGCRAERGAARAAETLSGPGRRAAGRAGRAQRGAARTAEPVTGGILAPARCARQHAAIMARGGPSGGTRGSARGRDRAATPRVRPRPPTRRPSRRARPPSSP